MSAEVTPQAFDAIVIGGGPAGAAAATVIAQGGRRVALLERTRFPRYHIGESLLPHAWWTLDRLGALDKVKAVGFQEKNGVRFISPDGRASRPFFFHTHMDHEAAWTWQVDRATFDRVLLDHAAASGVTVLQDTRALGLIEEDGKLVGVTAEGPEGPVVLRAPWTVDASGREGFVRAQRGWARPERALDRVAVWTYYADFPLDDVDMQRNTVVASVPEDGWFWIIPLAGGVTSVGVVARREVLFRETKDREAAFARQVASNPWIAERVAKARRVEGFDTAADYSYRSTYCADHGVVLAGDAFAFLDPVFSSGVFLALRTGEEAGRGVLSALDAGRTDPGVFTEYGEWACQGIEAMRKLVISFYDPNFSMGKIVRAHPELRGDVTDLLIGNIFREYDALNTALASLVSLPDPVPYGRARLAEAAHVTP